MIPKWVALALSSVLFLCPWVAVSVDAQLPSDAANPCYIRLQRAKDAPRFQDFPMAAQRLPRPGKLILSSREAKRYRTMLREYASQKPDFAGRYKIAIIGCGTSCNFGAIIDESSGKISFDPALGVVSGVYVGTESDNAYELFRYRLDSRLLIIVGAPGEDENRDGLHFYEWTGSSFKLLRFIPRRQACSVGN